MASCSVDPAQTGNGSGPARLLENYQGDMKGGWGSGARGGGEKVRKEKNFFCSTGNSANRGKRLIQGVFNSKKKASGVLQNEVAECPFPKGCKNRQKFRARFSF